MPWRAALPRMSPLSCCPPALSQEPFPSSSLHPLQGLHRGKSSERNGAPSPPPAMVSLHSSLLVSIQQQEALTGQKRNFSIEERAEFGCLWNQLVFPLESAQRDVVALLEVKGRRKASFLFRKKRYLHPSCMRRRLSLTNPTSEHWDTGCAAAQAAHLPAVRGFKTTFAFLPGLLPSFLSTLQLLPSWKERAARPTLNVLIYFQQLLCKM